MPPVLWLLERIIYPGVLPVDIYLHPVARAGWVGVFATALNLLPVGQLDGGHILYALTGEKHRWISRMFIALLIPAGLFFWQGWLMWAALLFAFARRHPAIYDLTDIGARAHSPGRRGARDVPAMLHAGPDRQQFHFLSRPLISEPPSF